MVEAQEDLLTTFFCCTGMSPSASQPGCQDLPTRAARVVLGRKGAGVRRVLLEMASGAIKEFEFVRSVTIENGKGNIRLAFEAAICRFFSSASVNVRTDACRSVALLSAGRCYRSPGGLCSRKIRSLEFLHISWHRISLPCSPSCINAFTRWRRTFPSVFLLTTIIRYYYARLAER